MQQEDGDWLNGLCPFHDDRTMSFGYNVTDDVFKCFASCTDSGDLVDLWCEVKGYPERSTEGLRAFKREYAQEGLAPAPRKTPGQLRTRLDVKLPGEIPENVLSVMEPVSRRHDGRAFPAARLDAGNTGRTRRACAFALPAQGESV